MGVGTSTIFSFFQVRFKISLGTCVPDIGSNDCPPGTGDNLFTNTGSVPLNVDSTGFYQYW